MAAGDCNQLHLANYAFGPHNFVAVKVRKWHLRDDRFQVAGSRLAGVRLTILFEPRTAAVAASELG